MQKHINKLSPINYKLKVDQMRSKQCKRMGTGASSVLSLLMIAPSAYAHGEEVLFTVLFSVAAVYFIQIIFLILVRAALKTKWQCGMVIVAGAVLSWLYLIWVTGSFFEDIAIFVLLAILSWGVMLYLIYFQKPKSRESN